MTKLLIAAQPLAFGQASGHLTRYVANIANADILLIRQDEISALSIIPCALIIIDATPFSHVNEKVFRMGVPVVSINQEEAASLIEGNYLYLDGGRGVIQDRKFAISEGGEVSAEQAVTRDGVEIHLNASVGSLAGVASVRKNYAEAIGLLRSESFFPGNRQVPDYNFYIQLFSLIAAALTPKQITIRLLDLAKDKWPVWCDSSNEFSCIFGGQGSRLLDDQQLKKVFIDQVRAINHVALVFPIKIILPFITHVEELRFWKKELGLYLSHPVSIGAMVENPVAALSLPELLEEAEFVAIGCNDLMQNLFAADRTSQKMARYLDPYNPALFRFMQEVAKTAISQPERVQLCGLLPQIPGVMSVLIGLGFRVFSVQPTAIPYLKASMKTVDLVAMEKLAQSVCAANDSDTVKSFINSFYVERSKIKQAAEDASLTI